MTLFVLALLLQSIPPGLPPRPTNIKVGSTTEPARTVEFVPGTGTTYSLSCADGTCSVTINYTGGAPDVVNFTGASRTAPVKTGTTAPATCTVGDWFFKTDAVAGTNILLCTATNTWTQVQGGGGSGTGSSNYGQSFTSQTSVSLTHNAGTQNVLVSCYNQSNDSLIPDTVTVVNSNTVTVGFSQAQTGYCVVNSSGGGGGSGTVYTGTGLTGNGTQANPVRIDPSGGAANQAFYTASLSFGTINASSCAQLTISAPGATPGETVAAGFPESLPNGLTGHMYSGADVVVVRVCNPTTSNIVVPNNLNFNARIIRGF